jgi:signal transduction histidine kinase
VARFQRALGQRERLASLGRLSTVIAHEIRNPLMIIKAVLHTLRQPHAGTQEMGEAIADIDDEVDRLNRIVNEVLDFARPIRFELGPVDLNALCRESASAAQASPGPAIDLDLDVRLPQLTSDAERLRLALVNLLVNARQAVEKRGGMTLAAAGTAAADAPAAGGPPARVALSTRRHGASAVISIADAGVGIDPADAARIFDPYFTTKRGGTGLGLPIAKNIVEGLGGTIAVESALGAGTTIRIELPVSAERPS